MTSDESISQDFKSDKGWNYTVTVDRNYVYVEAYTPGGGPAGEVRVDRQAWMNIVGIANVLNLRASSEKIFRALELVSDGD